MTKSQASVKPLETKTPYSKPQVQIYGGLAEITRNVATGTMGADGNPNSNHNHTS